MLKILFSEKMGVPIHWDGAHWHSGFDQVGWLENWPRI
jgi:hypothetical protein